MQTSTPTTQLRRLRQARFLMSTVTIGLLIASLDAFVSFIILVCQLVGYRSLPAIIIAILGYVLVALLLWHGWRTRNGSLKRILEKWIQKPG